jgi:hypothetical protein
MAFALFSVSLDSPINPSDKRISRQPPNRSCQQPVNRTSEEPIGKEQQAANETRDVQVVEEVVHKVRKDPGRAATAGEEGVPVPIVILWIHNQHS